MKKNILVILTSAPYGNSKARDAIDFILTSAAYEQEISVIFKGDGVLQLLQNQNPDELGLKNTSSMIKAFEMYEVENVFADEESLRQRNLSTEHLISGIHVIQPSQVTDIINQADTVLTF